MEATAKVTYVRIAPRKVQIVLDLIRNQPADKAMAILKHTPKSASEVLEKLLKSAIANAEQKDQGPTLKRIRPMSKGRAYRINKKTSHINITLKEAE